jgi:hypothetical protein
LKRSEEVMEILEAFDLAGSLRGAAALVGAITRWLGAGSPARARRRRAAGACRAPLREADYSLGRSAAQAASPT